MYRQHTLLSQEIVVIEFEGISMEVPAGISVAAAVLGHAHGSYCRHSTISGEKRAPYCLIGVCHECLMEINGKPYQQACMTTVENGMKINKQDFSGDQ
jgi:predicted molibdopterin-dependent oxidoreductase YjgC